MSDYDIADRLIAQLEQGKLTAAELTEEIRVWKLNSQVVKYIKNKIYKNMRGKK